MSTNASPLCPRTIYLHFLSRRCDGLASSSIPDSYTATGYASSFLDSSPPSTFEKHFKDSAVATFNVGNADPNNRAALDSLASAFTRDYVYWKKYSFDREYSGIISSFNPIYDEMIIDYNYSDLSTRVHTPAFNEDPEELMHHDPSVSTCTASLNPCIMFYAWPGYCSGGHLMVPVMSLCLTDGRLKATYLFTDQVT